MFFLSVGCDRYKKRRTCSVLRDGAYQLPSAEVRQEVDRGFNDLTRDGGTPEVELFHVVHLL